MRRLLVHPAVWAVPLLGFASGSARADQLDLEVKKNAPEVLKRLFDRGVKTVGVLRFRIQDGQRPESFQTSPLNAQLATLLEDCLILANTAPNPLAMVRNVSETAGRKKVGNWYKDAAERKKLFDIDYPRAWKDGTTRPDVLLTGVLKVPGDLRRATLVIEAITDKNPDRIEEVFEFSYDCDVALLGDLGRSFRVAARNLERKDVIKLAFKEAAKTGADCSVSSLKDIGGIGLQIMADNQDITASARPPEGAETAWTLPSPGSKRIQFKLANQNGATRAVLIRLNGENLIRVEGASETSKFILDPAKRKELIVAGYIRQKDNKQVVVPIKSIVGDAAKATREQLTEQLASRAGYIDVEVVESVGSGDEPIEISSYALGKRNRAAVADADRVSLRSLQDALAKRNLLKRVVRTEKSADGTVVSRELFVPDEATAAEEIKKLNVVEFKNQQTVGKVAIKILPNPDTDLLVPERP